MSKVVVTITSTRGIMHLAENSRGREKSVEERLLSDAIDPNGRHLLYTSQNLPNDIIRTQWFVKLKDDDQPVEIWMDIDSNKILEVGTAIELDVPEEG